MVPESLEEFSGEDVHWKSSVGKMSMEQKVSDDELIASMIKQKSRELGKLITGALILERVEGTGRPFKSRILLFPVSLQGRDTGIFLRRFRTDS